MIPRAPNTNWPLGSDMQRSSRRGSWGRPGAEQHDMYALGERVAAAEALVRRKGSRGVCQCAVAVRQVSLRRAGRVVCRPGSRRDGASYEGTPGQKAHTR
jgi:hypothetical protein